MKVEKVFLLRFQLLSWVSKSSLGYFGELDKLESKNGSRSKTWQERDFCQAVYKPRYLC